jgi:hypothetical protein
MGELHCSGETTRVGFQGWEAQARCSKQSFCLGICAIAE